MPAGDNVQLSIMDFKDSIIQLSERVAKLKGNLQTEEATKNALIMPMLQALGYDVFNPFEVVPEMDCDLGKKGEKIDYAIKRGDDVIILVECKSSTQNLDLHSTQLARYYVSSNARFGVLTNGVEYRFYADLNKANIMDKKPFLVIDMLNLPDSDIEQLKKFHKSYYNESEILCTAQELQITIQVKELLNKNFQNPGDEFTRYFVKCINDWKSTAKQIEQYRPIVKKSIAAVINDIIAERLNVAIKSEENQVAVQTTDNLDDNKDADDELPDGVTYMDKQSGVTTTQEEIDAYNIVRSILRKQINASDIVYKDFKSYFAVGIANASYWWICRFSFGTRKKSVFFPADDYKSQEKIDIDTIDDLFKHADKIEELGKIAFSYWEKYKNKHSK